MTPARRKTLAAALLVAALNLFPLALWCAVGNLWGTLALRRAEAAWAATFAPLEGFAATFPLHPTNEAARELERLADPLGLELRATDDPAFDMEGPDRVAFKELMVLVKSHEERMRVRPDPVREAPPAEVQAFLEEHRGDLDTLVGHLASPEVPRWHQDARDGITARVPNLLGHFNLVRLLVVRASEAARGGDVAGEGATLRAAWRLWEGLDARCEYISRLISMAEASVLLAAIRKVDTPGEEWVERVSRLEPREALVRSTELEVWGMSAFVRGEAEMEGLGLGRGLTTIIQSPVGRPYHALGVAWYEREMLRQLDVLARQDPCDARELPEPAHTKGNFGGIAFSPPSGAFLRLARVEVARAVTLAVLEAKRGRARDGRYPLAISTAAPCRDHPIAYRALEGGGVWIGLEEPPGWPELSGPELPTHYEEAPDSRGGVPGQPGWPHRAMPIQSAADAMPPS